MIGNTIEDSPSRLGEKNTSPKLDVKQMIKTSAETYGDRVACWISMNSSESCAAITYNEMYADICGLAAMLIEMGMSEKRIAIVGERSYEWLVSFLAVASVAGAVVPLDKTLSINEFKYFLNVSECSGVIFSNALENTFMDVRNDGVTGLEIYINMDRKKNVEGIFSLRELISMGGYKNVPHDADNSAVCGFAEAQTFSDAKTFPDAQTFPDAKTLPEAQTFSDAKTFPDDTCAVVFTAGTMDVPKGVILSHKNIVTNVVLAAPMFDIGEHDIIFSMVPPHNVFECVAGILIPLYKGASIAFHYRFDASDGKDGVNENDCAEAKKGINETDSIDFIIHKVKATIFIGVPTHIEYLYKQLKKDSAEYANKAKFADRIRPKNETSCSDHNTDDMIFNCSVEIDADRARARHSVSCRRCTRRRCRDADLSLARHSVSDTISLGRITLDIRSSEQYHSDTGINSFNGLTTIISGGNVIKPYALSGFRNLGVRVLQCYCLTESTAIVAIGADSEAAQRNTVSDATSLEDVTNAVSACAPTNLSDIPYPKRAYPFVLVGRLLPGIKAKVFDPDPITGIGELCLSGSCTMQGYCTACEETSRSLKGGWLFTGDMGVVDEGGYVYLAGRKDNIINLENGKRIFPEEMEYMLNCILYVQESMMWEDISRCEPLITATVLIDEDEIVKVLGKGFSDIEAEKLLWDEIDKLSLEIPDFKRIGRIVLRREDFQKNSSQKIIEYFPENKT